jgi:hypothetical protein
LCALQVDKRRKDRADYNRVNPVHVEHCDLGDERADIEDSARPKGP